MPVPATIETVAPPADLSDMTTEKLRALLTRSLVRTAQELTRLAWIVRILEERGEDLTDLRLGLLGYLRQIAYGKILPEVVVRFAERPALIQRIAALPTPEQQALASGNSLLLVVRKDDGTYDHRQADPLKMSGEQLRQVFGPGRIRDEAEQILALSSRARPATKKPAQPKKKIVADAEKGGLWIGRTFVPTATLVEALGSMKDLNPDVEGQDEEPLSTVVCRLTEREHYRLKRAALDGDSNANVLIRRALLMAGLLSGPDKEN